MLIVHETSLTIQKYLLAKHREQLYLLSGLPPVLTHHLWLVLRTVYTGCGDAFDGHYCVLESSSCFPRLGTIVICAVRKQCNCVCPTCVFYPLHLDSNSTSLGSSQLSVTLQQVHNHVVPTNVW